MSIEPQVILFNGGGSVPIGNFDPNAVPDPTLPDYHNGYIIFVNIPEQLPIDGTPRLAVIRQRTIGVNIIPAKYLYWDDLNNVYIELTNKNDYNTLLSNYTALRTKVDGISTTGISSAEYLSTDYITTPLRINNPSGLLISVYAKDINGGDVDVEVTYSVDYLLATIAWNTLIPLRIKVQKFILNGSSTAVGAGLGDTGWVDINFGPNFINAHIAPKDKPQFRFAGGMFSVRGSSTISPSIIGATPQQDSTAVDPRFITTPLQGEVLYFNGSISKNIPLGTIINGVQLPTTFPSNIVLNIQQITRSLVTSTGKRIPIVSEEGLIYINTSGVIVVSTIQDSEILTGVTVNGSSNRRLSAVKISIGELPLDYSAVKSSSSVNPYLVSIPTLTGCGTHTQSCDSSDARQLGGFLINFNGTLAFLDEPVVAPIFTPSEPVIITKSLVFEFESSNIWVAAHNTNQYPIVTAIDEYNVELEGVLTYLDFNQVMIEFNTQMTGKLLIK